MRRLSILGVIVLVSCRDGRLPVQPSTDLMPPTQLSLSGVVLDQAFGGIADARVEVTTGSQVGAVTTTRVREVRAFMTSELGPPDHA